MPNSGENPSRDDNRRETRRSTDRAMNIFNANARLFDAQADAVLRAPRDSGMNRNIEFTKAMYEDFERQLLATADYLEAREEVRERIRIAVERLHSAMSASGMRLAEQQTAGENGEETLALYRVLMQRYVDVLRMNPRGVMETVQSFERQLSLLTRLHTERESGQRVLSGDFEMMAVFADGLRTDIHPEAKNDPQRLLKLSILGAIVSLMTQDELVAFCRALEVGGEEGRNTARYLLISTVSHGNKTVDEALGAGLALGYSDEDFSRKVAGAGKTFARKMREDFTPEMRSATKLFHDNAALHNMTKVKYVGTSNVLLVGIASFIANLSVAGAEAWSETKSKPWYERIIHAVPDSLARAASNPLVYASAGAVAVSSHLLSGGTLGASVINAPGASLRESVARIERKQELYDFFGGKRRALIPVFVNEANFSRMRDSAESQKRISGVPRPLKQDAPDFSGEELEAFGFGSEDEAKEYSVLAFEILFRHFPEIRTARDADLFLTELMRRRPSRLDIPSNNGNSA